MDSVGIISKNLLATGSFPTSSWTLRLAVHLQDETQSKSLIQDYKAHPGTVDVVFSCLLYLSRCPEMLEGRRGKVQFFFLYHLRGFTSGICCTAFLRFAFDTCSVNTKQGCYFSNIKGHFHGDDCIWWCYISHILSLSWYMLSEIPHGVYPNQRFSKNIKVKCYNSLSVSTFIWRNVSLEGSSLNGNW